MKTQAKKLSLNKSTLVELTNESLLQVNGGDDTGNGQTTFMCGDCILVPTEIRTITKVTI